MQTSYEISATGMTCGHCWAAVEQALGAIGGVTSVVVDRSAGVARVQAEREVATSEFASCIDDIGFEFVSATPI